MQISLIFFALFAATIAQAQAQPTGRTDLPSGKETILPNEDADTDAIKNMILKKLEAAQKANPSADVGRDQHTKSHGCVKATFSVQSGLPAELRHGVFATAKDFSAWLRFSNGKFGINPDTDNDVRGLAIKLVNVEGDKLLANDERKTQDFLLANHPNFFVKNGKDYVELFSSFARFSLFHASDALKLLQALNHVIGSPLESDYWSQTPYRLGSENASGSGLAVKYHVTPISCDGEALTATPKGTSANYLREAMIERFKKGDACFAFQVQPQKNDRETPIEDATVSWDSVKAPFITVAKIRMKRDANQGKLELDNKDRMEFCENLANSPWHSLPDHRPLGIINRIRKTVYQTIANFRRERNRVVVTEPTGDEKF